MTDKKNVRPQYAINPFTGRPIRVGGRTYKKIIRHCRQDEERIDKQESEECIVDGAQEKESEQEVEEVGWSEADLPCQENPPIPSCEIDDFVKKNERELTEAYHDPEMDFAHVVKTLLTKKKYLGPTLETETNSSQTSCRKKKLQPKRKSGFVEQEPKSQDAALEERLKAVTQKSSKQTKKKRNTSVRRSSITKRLRQSTPHRKAGYLARPVLSRQARLKTLVSDATKNPLRTLSQPRVALPEQPRDKETDKDPKEANRSHRVDAEVQERKNDEKLNEETAVDSQQEKEKTDDLVNQVCQEMWSQLRVGLQQAMQREQPNRDPQEPSSELEESNSDLEDLAHDPDESKIPDYFSHELYWDTDRSDPALENLLRVSHKDLFAYEDFQKPTWRKGQVIYDCFHDWLSSKNVGAPDQHVFGPCGFPISDDEMWELLENGQILNVRKRKVVDSEDTIRFLSTVNQSFD